MLGPTYSRFKDISFINRILFLAHLSNKRCRLEIAKRGKSPFSLSNSFHSWNTTNYKKLHTLNCHWVGLMFPFFSNKLGCWNQLENQDLSLQHICQPGGITHLQYLYTHRCHGSGSGCLNCQCSSRAIAARDVSSAASSRGRAKVIAQKGRLTSPWPNGGHGELLPWSNVQQKPNLLGMNHGNPGKTPKETKQETTAQHQYLLGSSQLVP